MKKIFTLKQSSNLGKAGILIVGAGYKFVPIKLLTLLLFLSFQMIPGLALAQLLGQGSSARHSTAISGIGKVFIWGDNEVGQLGIDRPSSQATPQEITCIGSLQGKKIISIASGWRHTLALAEDGTVHSWGTGNNGELGLGPEVNKRSSYKPTHVSTISDVIKIAVGLNHSLAVKSDGTVWAWGFGGNGELGTGTKDNSFVPVKVANLSGVTEIAAGYRHNLAIVKNGTVYSVHAWGFGGNGQLGDGKTTSSNLPVEVSGLTGETPISSIAAGSDQSLAVSGGKILAWGWGGYGQLGDGKSTSSSVPVQAVLSANVISVAAGQYHCMALTSNGSVYTWGGGLNGVLGTNSYHQTNKPVQVILPSTMTGISAGSGHSLTVNSGGTVYAWGYGKYGELGNGVFTMNETSVPTPVLGPNLNILGFKPSLSSSAAASNNTICKGAEVTFTAGEGYANYAFFLGSGTSPVQNGVSRIYKTRSLEDGNKIRVVATSAGGCSATSEEIAMVVNELPAPSLASSASVTNNSITICAGDNVTFTAAEGFSKYIFYLNENPVTEDEGSPNTYTTSTLSNGDVIKVVVTNSSGCSATSSLISTTVNTLPSVSLSSFTDVCISASSFTLSGGSPAGGNFSGQGVINGTFNPAIAGIGVHILTYTYTDGVCTSSATSTITVKPLIIEAVITGPGTVAIGTLTPSTSAYSIPAITDVSATYTWVVTYNEGGIDKNINGHASGGVSYITPNEILVTWPTDVPRVYKVKVEYGNGACKNGSEAFVSVYDPSGGFVTGGGWLNSPTGAYTPNNSADEDVIGKANFGFVSKYKKGSSTPEGNTEFQFHAGNLNFKSSIYTSESLVVGGARAKYSGKGTVASSPGEEYNFFVSVVDGNIDNSGADRFRIKIWKMDGTVEYVLYDNNAGATLEQDPAMERTTISGGSIVIHEVKTLSAGPTVKKISAGVSVLPEASNMSTYPNPYTDKTTITFTTDTEENYSLEVYDMKGALVKRLASGKTEAGKINKFEFNSSNMAEGVYVARLVTSSRIQNQKMVMKR